MESFIPNAFVLMCKEEQKSALSSVLLMKNERFHIINHYKIINMNNMLITHLNSILMLFV
jgi:hypothetical protein